MGKKNKIIIIGGISAGTTAAVKARRFSEAAEIIIYEKDKYISYGTCGLPYYISGKIGALDSLILNTPATFEERFNIKVKTQYEVLEIKPDKNLVIVKNLENGKEFEDSYDNLIIATGSEPIRLKPDGHDPSNVFVLKTIDDGIRIKEFLHGPGIADSNGCVVIIGGGFIGLELLEAFMAKGFKVSIIERDSRILPVFDSEMTGFLENYLIGMGVEIIKEDEAVKLEYGEGDRVTAVVTGKGRNIKADIIIIGIGTRPSTGLAAKSGISTGSKGAIEVDNMMRTNISNIYAAGDCCQCRNLVTGSYGAYNLASIASRQGRTAGYNAAGGKEEFEGSIVISLIKVLDLVMAKTGTGKKEAVEAGFNICSFELHAMSNVGYYPGASMIHMMVIFKKDTGEITGYQAVGKNGVDKRADILSVAIKNKLKIWDLAGLDLGYQPAYGSAKDPVNMLGMIGENLKKGEVEFISPAGLKKIIAGGEPVTILDVRSEKEFEDGFIEGAVNIPVDRLRSGTGQLDKDRETVIYCRSGYRAYLGLRILKNMGFDKVRLLDGSYLSWVRKI